MHKLFIYISLVACNLFLVSSIYATTTSTDSADIDPETIKENIKKRIEQVIKDQAEINKKRVAYIGNLNSFTTNSFSIETNIGGTKQASTSAATVVIELPRNKQVTLGDISIGDYIAALGYLNDNTQVLDTRRILILKNRPLPTTQKSTVGVVKSLDAKRNILVLRNIITQQETSFKVSLKATIQLTDNSLIKTKISFRDIPTEANCLIIYEPAETETEMNLATSLLIKSQSASPSAKPKN